VKKSIIQSRLKENNLYRKKKILDYSITVPKSGDMFKNIKVERGFYRNRTDTDYNARDSRKEDANYYGIRAPVHVNRKRYKDLVKDRTANKNLKSYTEVNPHF
jgi:hypothetical protein